VVVSGCGVGPGVGDGVGPCVGDGVGDGVGSRPGPQCLRTEWQKEVGGASRHAGVSASAISSEFGDRIGFGLGFEVIRDSEVPGVELAVLVLAVLAFGEGAELMV